MLWLWSGGIERRSLSPYLPLRVILLVEELFLVAGMHRANPYLLRNRYGLAEPLRREQELSSVRAGDGMGFTAFRTEKSVSEEILRGEEAEVGGWEGVFGSGELRSFFYLGGVGWFWFCC